MKNFIFRYLISLIIVLLVFGAYIYFSEDKVSYYGKLGSFKYTIIFFWPYANLATSLVFYGVIGSVSKRKIFIFLGSVVVALIVISLILNNYFITEGFFNYLVAYTWVALLLAITQLLMPNFTTKPHRLDYKMNSSYLTGILAVIYMLLFLFLFYYKT
ncbi:hypothetical protein EZJ43_07980 [Pedobacter changchengzhani]|uniref:Uncharacterized protein n=1 Tax=Pedobacter changchengzhani TaxID=2529274 RepID=A0A4R5ML23_9SPHI|nr:hypothetical protein [Pedobacter changchengzhani]TDG36447.1 hypothetical protein EZJ43_07980 [Pedobacter changchengzhani]